MQAKSVGIVGLGYVGLPLALAFGTKVRTIGFDVDKRKIESYKNGVDPAGLITQADFKASQLVKFTNDASLLNGVEMIIIAVPTPIDESKAPDLSYLEGASIITGKNLSKGTVVVYESTVYPGVTEEFCVPILEKYSGLKCGTDFKVGYSPERINPGDPDHTLEKIVKVVSAQDPQTLEFVANTYEMVVEAGVYRAPSIKVAEAAKVIENTQRDLNIALMNELALIFNRLGIDTLEVLKAAGTKWNFLPFRPGLVGGHCIGVDPYYLTHLAKRIGYHPEVILAGRRINDSMGIYVAQRTIKELLRQRIPVEQAKVAVLGVTFKENCPDIRNTRVVDIVNEIRDYGIVPKIHDPLAAKEEIKEVFSIEPETEVPLDVDALILAVPHKEYVSMLNEIVDSFKKKNKGVIMDVKSVIPLHTFKGTGIVHWRL
ncbi:UDP-glucose dehydrogenase [Dissulfuribacter thermophilus]|uniref:UDP-glucose dehydrogenase n=1 Tax=Dissulfuribacter thermophilus TaxID=1156395 RepID=A0A1B9F5I6_9BACT|nr:nucleotide sugar dehydrogenase [Dissulfuribacter thermophilus]OCC15104.1 UDP-glucose dehydrogenase [Dissulfuribacter thermophilus]